MSAHLITAAAGRRRPGGIVDHVAVHTGPAGAAVLATAFVARPAVRPEDVVSVARGGVADLGVVACDVGRTATAVGVPAMSGCISGSACSSPCCAAVPGVRGTPALSVDVSAPSDALILAAHGYGLGCRW